MSLEAMFPTGRWDEGRGKLLVKKGAYFWPAVERTEDGGMKLTDFGRRTALFIPENFGAPPPVVAFVPAPPPVVISKPKQKRIGKKASVFHPTHDDVDDLEL